ncbi:hypothetical protein PACTADRAFT_50449 [Pachysolen tannophilus NRRL Y-2460]|uniref:ATP synthase subunit 4 n=1 Tax=Pachysolen tannophilus NRRL Y-2460 TaxID=669874 RepID=A0A1E4TS31_PACTA|nr:hypothetical protein PACTADRAFT_50449 [Pachysolen tannophilus NRRL Y-2460]
MSSRLSLRAIRPISMQLNRSIAPITPIGIRYLSTPVDPKTKANSIIDALPGNSALSKTGILATSTAAAVYAVSNGLFVFNDEAMLLITFTGFVAMCSRVLAPLYGEWASSTIKSIVDILNSSRSKHVEAVQSRIDQVTNLKDVVATTKTLFEISKETAQLEAEAFELKQKVALAAEAKSVLESWVRHENNLRQAEQQQLAATVIANVEKEVGNPKFQERVLLQAVDEIEKVFKQ